MTRTEPQYARWQRWLPWFVVLIVVGLIGFLLGRHVWGPSIVRISQPSDQVGAWRIRQEPLDKPGGGVPQGQTPGRELGEAAGNTANAMSQRSADDLCREFLASDDAVMKGHIAETLSRMGARQALPILAMCTMNGEENVLTRQKAIVAIGRLGGRDWVPFLSKYLTIDEAGKSSASLAMWFAAIETLGRMGDPAVVPQILPFLDPKNSVTALDPYGCIAAAAEALGRLGDERGIPPLLDLTRRPASSDRIPYYRIGVALMELKCKEGIPLYLKYAGGDFLEDLPVFEALLERMPVSRERSDAEGIRLRRELAAWWEHSGEDLQWNPEHRKWGVGAPNSRKAGGVVH